MNNCLVTTLKGAAQNNNLEYFGALRVNVSAEASGSESKQSLTIQPVSGKNLKITVIGNTGYFATSYAGLSDPSSRLTSLTVSDTTTIYVANMNFSILISEKYNIKRFTLQIDSIMGIDIAGLEYSQGLFDVIVPTPNVSGNIAKLPASIDTITIPYSKVTGEISSIRASNLHQLKINSTNIEGTLDDLSQYLSLEVFTGNLGTLITGDISDIANLSSLRQFNAPPKVTGTIEGFVAAAISNNRNSGTINTLLCNSKIKFGQNTIGSSESYALTWNTANYITMVGNSKVYAKGATAEEITAWENAGKTVVIVS